MNLLLYLSMFSKKVLLNALSFEETLCPWLWEQKQKAAGPVHCISHHKALQAGPCPAPPDLRDTRCWEHVVPVGEGKVMWTAPLRTRWCYRAIEVGAVCRCDGFSAASQLVPSTCDSGQVHLSAFYSMAILQRKWKEVVLLLDSTLYPAPLNADERVTGCLYTEDISVCGSASLCVCVPPPQWNI